ASPGSPWSGASPTTSVSRSTSCCAVPDSRVGRLGDFPASQSGYPRLAGDATGTARWSVGCADLGPALRQQNTRRRTPGSMEALKLEVERLEERIAPLFVG